MRRFILAILVALAVGGCGPTIQQQLDLQFGQTFDARKSLLLAIESYRVGSGRWPKSPQQLRDSKFVDQAVGFDRYENLRFEPLPNGGLAVRFDRWTGRAVRPVMSNVGIELGPPEPVH